MQRFTQLYTELDQTTRTLVKVDALRRYFSEADPASAAWALSFMTGRRVKRAINYKQLRDWASQESGIPAWLLDESYGAVGDLSETIALVLPPPAPEHVIEHSLAEVAETIITKLPMMGDDQRRDVITRMWRELPTERRFIFNKLIVGNFRVGASQKLVTRALAELAGIDPAVMSHRLMGNWPITQEFFQSLLSNEESGGATHPAQPYPFFLASPLDDINGLGEQNDWLIEWKWDGIRAQVIRRGGETIIWSRGQEIINDTYPEIADIARALPDGTVLDGEILAWENGRVLPFGLLQRRIGRKNVSPSFWPEVPIAFMAFDVLEFDRRDVRTEALSKRRGQLESLVANLPEQNVLLVSPTVACESWDECGDLKSSARDVGAEGVMIKRLSSPYGTGRTRGDWWKWKSDPYSIDAVLMYAQPGTGKRASLLTDYTFGVWDEGRLVPVAKAYSGLTDEEIRAVDKRIRETTIERKGPVRMVKPEMVFEIAFEGIAESNRHASGVAVRFPRMARWRQDKKSADADSLDTLKAILKSHQSRNDAAGAGARS